MPDSSPTAVIHACYDIGILLPYATFSDVLQTLSTNYVMTLQLFANLIVDAFRIYNADGNL